MPGITGEKRWPWNFGSYSVEWISIPCEFAISDQGFCISRTTHLRPLTEGLTRAHLPRRHS